MNRWLHAEYRDFDAVPRAMVCTSPRGTYYFLSRFDRARGAYADTYEVYRMNPMGEGEKESAVMASLTRVKYTTALPL